MARKQTRRTISINRSDYEAAKIEASRRGVTLAALVEAGLAVIGVPVIAHPQQSVELAQLATTRRAESSREKRLPSRERQLLGDRVADAHGFA